MVTSGAKFVLGVIICLAAFVAVWWIVSRIPLAEPNAVLLTGFGAILVAVLALFTQRNITRRQCTLEHLAALQMDSDLIKFRVMFRDLAKQQGGLAVWAAADKEQTEEFQAISTRLNEFELIAIGIQRGIIDFELYRRWYKSGTIRAWRDAEGFINGIRNRFNNQMLFHELQEMVRWFEEDDHPPRRSWIKGTFF